MFPRPSLDQIFLANRHGNRVKNKAVKEEYVAPRLSCTFGVGQDEICNYHDLSCRFLILGAERDMEAGL